MEENKESSNCLLLLRNNFFLERARYENNIQSTWVESNDNNNIYIALFPFSTIALYNNYSPK